MKRILAAAVLAAATAMPVLAHDYGFAGLLSKDNRETLEPLTLGSGKPVAAAPYELKSGTYYKMKIVADGSAELALSGGISSARSGSTRSSSTRSRCARWGCIRWNSTPRARRTCPSSPSPPAAMS